MKAVYRSEYMDYAIDCRNEGLPVKEIQFSGCLFRTSDEKIIEFLDGHVSEGVSFYKVEGQNKVDNDWRERLEERDNPGSWSEETLMKFKNGEEVFRCEYDCGYANHHKPATSSHENHCSNNTDDKTEEE